MWRRYNIGLPALITFAPQQFRRWRVRHRLMSDCHSFGSGAFSMSLATFRRDFRDLSFGAARLLGSRVGSRRGGDSGPFFRLNPTSEACRSSVPAWFVGVGKKTPGIDRAPRRIPVTSIGCGKVTNRTSGPYGSVRPLHLNSYGAGTRSRPKRRPPYDGQRAINRSASLLIRGNEKERVSTTSSGLRAPSARDDRSLLGIDRLRLVCERVQLRR